MSIHVISSSERASRSIAVANRDGAERLYSRRVLAQPENIQGRSARSSLKKTAASAACVDERRAASGERRAASGKSKKSKKSKKTS